MVMQMIVNIFFFVSCLCIESVFRLTIYRRKDNFFTEKFRILPKNSNKFGFIALAFHYLYPILTHISETDEIRQTFIPGRWIVDRRFPGISAEERQA